MKGYDSRTCDYFWFLSYRNDFCENHFAKRVLIKDRKVLGFYDTYLEAIFAAEDKGLKEGEYIIQLCVYEGQEEEYGIEPVYCNRTKDELRDLIRRKKGSDSYAGKGQASCGP